MLLEIYHVLLLEVLLSAELLTGMNNIITKINTTYGLNIRAMVLADIPACPDPPLNADIRTGVNAIFKIFNQGTVGVMSKQFDMKSNLGFEERKKLLFNTTGNVMAAADAGKFKFRIPLDHLFNFCKFYRNGIYNARHEIRFTRQSDDMVIYRDVGVANPGKIVLSDLKLFMPRVDIE